MPDARRLDAPLGALARRQSGPGRAVAGVIVLACRHRGQQHARHRIEPRVLVTALEPLSCGMDHQPVGQHGAGEKCGRHHAVHEFCRARSSGRGIRAYGQALQSAVVGRTVKLEQLALERGLGFVDRHLYPERGEQSASQAHRFVVKRAVRKAHHLDAGWLDQALRFRCAFRQGGVKFIGFRVVRPAVADDV